jgi:hypothetical protein
MLVAQASRPAASTSRSTSSPAQHHPIQSRIFPIKSSILCRDSQKSPHGSFFPAARFGTVSIVSFSGENPFRNSVGANGVETVASGFGLTV